MKPINNETIAHLIEECKGQTEVELLLDCSSGGDPYSAIAFNSFIKNSQIKLEVNIISRCISAGIFLLCTGQVRKATKTAVFLIHQNNRTFNETLTIKDMEWHLESMKKLKANLLGILCKTTDRSYDELEKIYDQDSELSSEEAFELGLLTEEPY